MKSNRDFMMGMGVIPFVLIGLGLAVAGNVSTPNTFVADTPAVAAEVNANFAAHEAAINDNDARIGDNDTRIDALGTRVQTLETQVTNLPVVYGNASTSTGVIGVGPRYWTRVIEDDVVVHEVADQPYEVTIRAYVRGNGQTTFQAPDTPGQLNLEIVFYAGSVSEVRRAVTLQLDATAGLKSVTHSGTWPSLPGETGHDAAPPVIELHQSSATAEVGTAQDLWINMQVCMHPLP